MGKIPVLGKWKLLTPQELEQKLAGKPLLDAYEKALLNLVKEGRVRAWLDEDGIIRYQYNPEPYREKVLKP